MGAGSSGSSLIYEVLKIRRGFIVDGTLHLFASETMLSLKNFTHLFISLGEPIIVELDVSEVLKILLGFCVDGIIEL